MSIDWLYTKVLVRRAGGGAAPFTWEIVGASPGTPLFVSSERFRSMEAAYSAGQARLAEFVPGKPARRGRWERPAGRQAPGPVIDWHADEAEETGEGGDLEADCVPGQDGHQGHQPHPAMLEDRAT